MKLRIKSGHFSLFALGALPLIVGAFWLGAAADDISVRRARELIQNIAGAKLTPEQVRIKSISAGVGGGGTIVEAQIETAFRITKGKDGWRIAEARIGAGQWESFELIEEALRREKVRRTNDMLRNIADGLGAYKNDRGHFVEADRITELLDHLSPQYVKSPQRVDLWGKELEYQGSATSYRLISYGPDRKSGTKDDLIIENGALKTGAN
ncbi:MAG: type II secretion system protein GspG [Chloracidobacterium sp.]|nr:type II secretion system protein GspG [Chloracidobacterium sp.]